MNWHLVLSAFNTYRDENSNKTADDIVNRESRRQKTLRRSPDVKKIYIFNIVRYLVWLICVADVSLISRAKKDVKLSFATDVSDVGATKSNIWYS